MGRGGIPEPEGPVARFCGRLRRLQEASGVKQSALAAKASLGKSQMSAILNGQIKKAPDWKVAAR